MNPVSSFDTELGLWVRSHRHRRRHRHDRAHHHRRRGLALGLRDQVRRLRRQAARRRPSPPTQLGPASTAPRILHRHHPQPRLARLHRRLGLRARLVHGAGDRHDPRPPSSRPCRPWSRPRSRSARCEARDAQQRAPRHLPQRRGADSRLAARHRGRRRREGRRRGSSRRSAPTPPTPRPAAPTAASPTPTGPDCSSSALEERFGGVGLHFMTGLGNLSNRGGVTIGTSWPTCSRTPAPAAQSMTRPSACRRRTVTSASPTSR